MFSGIQPSGTVHIGNYLVGRVHVKSVLIVGDSITAGIPGARYTTVLRRALPDYRFLISGRPNDTLVGASRRTKSILAKVSPDLVVFEIGANDILLPYLASRGGVWRMAVRLLEKGGSIPATNAQEFRRLYTRVIEQVRRFGVSQIVVTTITCLGEDPTSQLSVHRQKYNTQIRNLAEQENVHLADVGRVFDDLLNTVTNPSPYLQPRFWLIPLDVLITRAEKGADYLSRRRRLRITTDGVHLNRLGAQLVAETIEEQVRC